MNTIKHSLETFGQKFGQGISQVTNGLKAFQNDVKKGAKGIVQIAVSPPTQKLAEKTINSEVDHLYRNIGTTTAFNKDGQDRQDVCRS